eukprot:TRINITY_DN3721_c0_g1_i1.p1 TRINITY_DN3721_c0_g1~~TRINITY_DN3721_c0_g1_i1.p1  ORF type:complete len:219 (+),score=35.99 TRINITY_DN3721_c0_g1_i1:192-848(+)
MEWMEKVVVAVNQQRHGWLALAYSLVKEEIKAGDSVLLCHVIEGKTGILTRICGDADGEEIVECMELRLANMAKMLIMEKGLHVESRLERGDVAGQIISVVNNFQATKLIMGCGRARHGIPRQGSMSRKVVDAIKHKCTVIVATKEEELYRHDMGERLLIRHASEYSTWMSQKSATEHHGAQERPGGEWGTFDTCNKERTGHVFVLSQVTSRCTYPFA